MSRFSGGDRHTPSLRNTKHRKITRPKYILQMIPDDLYDNENWNLHRLIVLFPRSRLDIKPRDPWMVHSNEPR